MISGRTTGRAAVALPSHRGLPCRDPARSAAGCPRLYSSCYTRLLTLNITWSNQALATSSLTCLFVTSYSMLQQYIHHYSTPLFISLFIMFGGRGVLNAPQLGRSLHAPFNTIIIVYA